jgi:hypothetical protein
MGEYIEVDRAFWNPYSEESEETKDKAQQEFEGYLETRPYLDRWGNVHHPESGEIMVKKYTKMQRHPHTNRIVDGEAINELYDDINDSRKIKKNGIAGTAYDCMDYDNMTPVQLAKCEALARRGGEEAKADKLREIRHERAGEQLEQDRAKRPTTFSAQAYEEAFSGEAYTGMSELKGMNQRSEQQIMPQEPVRSLPAAWKKSADPVDRA